MKIIYYFLIASLVVLTGCGEIDSLSQFSKRKYLKKGPKQNAIEQVIQPELETFAGSELTPESFVKNGTPQFEYVLDIEEEKSKFNKFNDTIITNKGDTFVGKIMYLRDSAITYKFDPKLSDEWESEVLLKDVSYWSSTTKKYSYTSKTYNYDMKRKHNLFKLISLLCFISAPFLIIPMVNSIIFGIPLLLWPIFGIMGWIRSGKYPLWYRVKGSRGKFLSV
jgi:hypothetical protein